MLKTDPFDKPQTTLRELTNLERLWNGLMKLIEQSSSAHFHSYEGESDREWSATILFESEDLFKTRDTVFASGATFEHLIVKLVDGDSEKICVRCRERKSLSAFSIDRARSDGRCGTCRKCESARVSQYQKEKRRKAREQLATPAGAVVGNAGE